MTAFIPQTQTNYSRGYSAQEIALKDYALSTDSTFKLMFDQMKGVTGLLQEQGKQISVSFENIGGIQKNLKFDEVKLKRFLDETYVVLRRAENGQVSAEVNPRLRGGGGGHSHHSTQSYTVPPPPQPTIRYVNYSAGFPVQNVILTPQSEGSYLNAAGGNGTGTYSVQFQTFSGTWPHVAIHIWKRDYFAQLIAQWQQTSVGQSNAKAAKLVEKQTTEASKAAIMNMLETLKSHKATQSAHEQTRQQLSNEIAASKAEVDKNTALLASVQNQIAEEGPNIRTLSNLINLINDLGMNTMFQPCHVPLHQFAANGTKETMIGSVENQNSLLGKTITSLKKVIAESQKATGKDIVAIAGNTGTGKSTAVNYLLGKPMQPVPGVKNALQVAEGHAEIAKIGHHVATSETLYTQICEVDGIPFIFADCGGYFDTRGTSSDIAVITSLKQTLDSSKTTKLVLSFDMKIIEVERGRLFKDSVGQSLKLLKNYKDHSVLVMFTKPTRDFNNILFSAQDAIQSMTEIMNDLPEGSEDKTMYQYLLRDNGKYICVCDPLSETSRNTIHQLLKEMTPIADPKNTFQVAFNPATQLELLEEMTKTAVKANELFANHAAITARIAAEKNKYTALNFKLAAAINQKAQIDAQVAQDEAYLQNNTLDAVITKMRSIDQQIASLEQQIQNYNAQIAARNTTEIVVYTSTGNGKWTITNANGGPVT